MNQWKENQLIIRFLLCKSKKAWRLPSVHKKFARCLFQWISPLSLTISTLFSGLFHYSIYQKRTAPDGRSSYYLVHFQFPAPCSAEDKPFSNIYISPCSKPAAQTDMPCPPLTILSSAGLPGTGLHFSKGLLKTFDL